MLVSTGAAQVTVPHRHRVHRGARPRRSWPSNSCSRRSSRWPRRCTSNDGKVRRARTRAPGAHAPIRRRSWCSPIGVFTAAADDPPTTPAPRPRPVREPRPRPPSDDRSRPARAGTAANGRHDLPWRATRDRWLVLVSEVMLHQTQAPRVAQVYDAFVEQFPTPAATAAAGPAAVIAAWGRLGYPRRARWLWEAARAHRRDGGPTTSASCPASAATPPPRSPRRPTTPTRSASRSTSAACASACAATRLSDTEAEARRGRDRGAAARTRPAARAHGPRRDGVHRACARVRSLPDRARLRDARRARRRDPAPPGGATRDRSASGAATCSRGCATGRSRRGRARRRSARVAPRRRPRRSHARSRAPPALADATRADREEVAQEVVPARR